MGSSQEFGGDDLARAEPVGAIEIKLDVLWV